MIKLKSLIKEMEGGQAQNVSLADIARKHNVEFEYIKQQLLIGIKIEMEHTNNRDIAKDIAKDHLFEIPDYYTRLIKMEKDAEHD